MNPDLRVALIRTALSAGVVALSYILNIHTGSKFFKRITFWQLVIFTVVTTVFAVMALVAAS